MFKVLFPISLACVAIHTADVCGQGRNFYVSSLNGDDADDGRSPLNAWASVTRLNQEDLEPGDHVYLERGSLWTDATLYLSYVDSGSALSPVTVGAYGLTVPTAPAILAPNVHIYLNDSGWNQHSTYTNVYSRSFAFGVHEARFVCIRQAGGLFWPFIAIEGCGSTDDCIEEVSQTPGSCYNDPNSTTWYIHTPSSSDPRTDGIKYYVVQYDDARNAISVSGDYIYVSGINAAGAYVPIELTSSASHVTIDSCTATASNLGISTGGGDTRITGCTVKFSGDGVGSSAAQNVTIDHNTIVEGRPDIGEGEGIASGNTDQLSIHHNEVANYSRQIVIIGYARVDNLLISHNYLHSSINASLSGILLSEGPYGFGTDLLVHDNIIELTQSACCTVIGIHLASGDGSWQPLEAAQIFNNSIQSPNGLVSDHTSGGYGIDVGMLDFWNNLVVSSNRNIWIGATSDVFVDYNLYEYSHWKVDSGDYTSFGDYKAGTSFDANGINTEPIFCGSPPWKLKLPSPGTNAGVYLDWLEGVLDFYGVQHSNPPSIGAAEECSGSG